MENIINFESPIIDTNGYFHKEEQTRHIFLLEIDETGYPKIADDEVFTAQKNSILRVHMLNGSKITKKIRMVTNAHKDYPVPWYLENYFKRELSMTDVSEMGEYLISPEIINTSIIFNINLDRAGPCIFAFVYELEDLSVGFGYGITKQVYIHVDPQIVIGGREIKLSSIQMQTILSKSIGKLSEWEKYFKEASQLKFNFVHFTPIQQLGASDSLYCIQDNTVINDYFFECSCANDVKLSKIHEAIMQLRENYQIGSVVDIVLNHAASNSQWLKEHPECGYNLENTPWLTVAFELDHILVDYSNRFLDKKVACKSAPYINNERDLAEAVDEIARTVYKANLEEFFFIPIEKYIEEFQQFYLKNKEEFKDYLLKRTYLISEMKTNFGISIDKVNLNENLIYDLISQSCIHYGYSRYGVELAVEFVGLLIYESYPDKDRITESAFIRDVKKYINRINETWSSKANDMLKIAIENVREFIRYQFIQLQRTGVKRKLVDNYFVIFDPNDKRTIFACNGWIFTSDDKHDPTPNFTKYGTWYYFKRKIIIWSDCPKLNYGNSPDDCPYLMYYMTKYVQDMARIFNGFRLDNAHSTPLYVAQYLTAKAREVNPDLLVIGELFAGTKENEINFVNKIGINLLIRELIYCHSPDMLAEKISRFAGGKEHMIGKLEQSVNVYEKFEESGTSYRKCRYLIPRLPQCLIYDITHDNPTYHERYHNLGLNLTTMACLGLAETAIGSSRGFDQLFPYQPSVVKENRSYSYDDMFEETLQQLESIKSNKMLNINKNKEVMFEFNPKNSVNPHTSTVRLALSSTNWRPEINLTKASDALFNAKVILPKGTYYYKFVLDNNVWIHDNFKPSLKDNTGNINNVLDLTEEAKFTLPDLKLLRREINAIRNELNDRNTEFFLHKDRDLLCIIRMAALDSQYLTNPPEFDGYALICRTGYQTNKVGIFSRVELPGEIREFVCGMTISIPNFDMNKVMSEDNLNGIRSNVFYTQDMKFLNSIANVSLSNNKSVVEFHSIMPNTVIILKLKINERVKSSIIKLEADIKYLQDKGVELIKAFDLCDMNLALYKCEPEELDNTFKRRGIYKVSGWGKFSYAGIAHLHLMIQKLKKQGTTDHLIYQNVKEGDWLIGYTISRLSEAQTLLPVHSYIKDNILPEYSSLYPHYKPFYFSRLIDSLHHILTIRYFSEIQANVVNYGEFSQNLSLALLQFTGYIESSRFKYSFDPIDKPVVKLSIASGLPHFSTEFLRCWGRDTFISFKGLLLIPGFYSEAKQILKIYASTLRHGLIPNLLDGGIKPRYNSRDSTWYFLQALQDYISFTRDYSLLSEEVEMVFIDDDMNTHYSKKYRGEKKLMILTDIIQTIFQSHAKGISFREWRAGKEIDEHMKDEGFNVKIYLDPITGFIYGGNPFNCGTWMDKMGSSDKARNKGYPATPRNGANVEIIGLLYSSLKFLLSMIEMGFYPYKSVALSDGSNYPFSQWILLIKDNFESSFFVGKRKDHSNSNSNSNSSRENIYKDYLNYDRMKQFEYQLRPNFLIAMAVASDLFIKENALLALNHVEKYLLVENGIGIRSLDSEDKNYNGNCNVGDDGGNFSTAHGFNYHNGPEWVWPLGYYLIAKMKFNDFDRSELLRFICKRLVPLMKYIKSDDWRGLPEVTNVNSTVNQGSCNTHVRSVSAIFEAVYSHFASEIIH